MKKKGHYFEQRVVVKKEWQVSKDVVVCIVFWPKNETEERNCELLDDEGVNVMMVDQEEHKRGDGEAGKALIVRRSWTL